MSDPLDAREQRKQQALANRQFGKARKAIQAVRSFCITNAVICVVLAWMFSAADWNVGAGILLLLAVVSVTGALRVGKEPTLWAVVMGAGWFVLVAAQVVMGMAGGCIFWFSVIWTVALFLAAHRTQGIKELLAEHGDSVGARRLRAEMDGKSARKRR